MDAREDPFVRCEAGGGGGVLSRLLGSHSVTVTSTWRWAVQD